MRPGQALDPGEAWPDAGVHIRVRRGEFTLSGREYDDEGTRKQVVAQRIHPEANSLSVHRLKAGLYRAVWRIIKVHPNA